MNDINIAAKFINEGNLVVFPTETVYGIGADATNSNACKKIYEIKGRPKNNPLIVHVSSIEKAQEIGIFNKAAAKLSSLWPGPLTLVVPLYKTSNISKQVTANLDTIAIRIPAHKTILALLKLTKKPIAAPSANPSGYISTTCYKHVFTHFKDFHNIFILKGEKSLYGIESTIIDTTTPKLTILRHGFITSDIIEEITGQFSVTTQNNNIFKAPGMMLKHYSPITKIRMNSDNISNKEVGLNYGNSRLYGNYCLNLSPKGNLIEAAANLYYMLYKLDNYAQNNDIDTIAVAKIPYLGVGIAINDKLSRASIR